MKAAKYDNTGKKTGEVELPVGLFTEDFSKASIYAVIRIENRNRRQGTHKTKTISEVSGGGRKPWRQKGTGNARQGSTRAPQWRKGAIIFGPRPRDYSMKLPDKVRKSGIRSIFSAKAIAAAVSIIDDVTLDKFSTKHVYGIFKKMNLIPGNTVGFVVDTDDLVLKKSVSNLPLVQLVHAERVTAPELYYAGHLVISESALKKLTAKYGSQKSKVGAA